MEIVPVPPSPTITSGWSTTRRAARPRWSIRAMPRRRWPRRERRGWTITQVWNTHWHPDHTGGNVAIKEATGARISGPAAETIQGRDVALAEGDEVRLGDHVGRVIEVPGHTLGHIALIFDDDARRLCRRHLVRDGLRPAVRRNRRSRCTARSSGWRACPTTRALLRRTNIRSPTRASPPMPSPKPAIAARLDRSRAMRDAGRITLPTTVAQERETNPFVRATNVAGVRASAGGERQLPFMSKVAQNRATGIMRRSTMR